MSDETLLHNYWENLTQDQLAEYVRNIMWEEHGKQQRELERQQAQANAEWQATQKAREQQAKAVVEQAHQNAPTVVERYSQKYGLDNLPGKGWDKQAIASNLIGIEYAQSMGMSQRDMDELRKKAVLDTISNSMPMSEYVRMRKSGEMEALL